MPVGVIAIVVVIISLCCCQKLKSFKTHPPRKERVSVLDPNDEKQRNSLGSHRKEVPNRKSMGAKDNLNKKESLNTNSPLLNDAKDALDNVDCSDIF